jgi:hypothetical protein
LFVIKNIVNVAGVISCVGREWATYTAETDAIKLKCLGATLSRVVGQVYKYLYSFKSLQEEMAHINNSGAKKDQVPHEQYQRL